ncbi:hypothetical protein DL93DRAFT_1423305 [Clavulina sp. PMI_390]|nr:hypothetical protein DL93DRAFT_1423305 [Clavulina sp. PMI_390]
MNTRSTGPQRIIALANVQMIQARGFILQMCTARGDILGHKPPYSEYSTSSGTLSESDMAMQMKKMAQAAAKLYVNEAPGPAAATSRSQCRSRAPSMSSSTSHSNRSHPPTSRNPDNDSKHTSASSRRAIAAPYPPRIPTIPLMRGSSSPHVGTQLPALPSVPVSTRKQSPPSSARPLSEGDNGIDSRTLTYLLSRKPMAQLISTPSKSSVLYAPSRRRPMPAEEYSESLSSGQRGGAVG